MTSREFERLVDEAVASIPADFRREMRNLALVIEDEPPPELLAEMEIEPPDTLYGLYQGTPLTEREWSHETLLPDRITLYRGAIEADGPDPDDIRAAIAETLIHEIGHYFGLSEEEIEERYWRGVADDGDGPA
jgi:predicted Zn-dependent protease with MMP-like domain